MYSAEDETKMGKFYYEARGCGLIHSWFHCCFQIHGEFVPHSEAMMAEAAPSSEENIQNPELLRQ